MGDRKLIQYFNVQGWMLRDLGLSTNEALIYSVIFSFSHDGKSEYRGGRHYLAKSLDISFSTLDRALDNLVSTGYIIKDQFMYRNVVCNNYKVDLSKIARFLDDSQYRSQNEYPSQNDEGCIQNDEGCSQNDEHSITSIIKENNKKIEGKPSIPAKLDTLKHPRNFKREVLTDELNSIGELEEKAELEKQKHKERKKTLYQKCLDAIDNPEFDFREDVKQALRDFLPSTLQANVYAVRGVNQWNYRLKTLIQLSSDPSIQLKIITQSLNNSLTGFKALTYKGNKSCTADNSIITYQESRTDEEIESILESDKKEFGII